MPQPTVASIRRNVSAEARAKFDEIWEHRLTANEWPTDRWNYKRLPKPKFDALLNTLNGSYIVPIGALVTMLRSFGGVDQGNATAVGQLASIQEAIAKGAPIDEGTARAYCGAAEPVIVYLKSK